jgi:hypothetical protein
MNTHSDASNLPPSASNNPPEPKYGDGIEWKLKQVIGFLRDA